MNKKRLSLGKLRGLSQCANETGVFNILALDHRRAIKKVFQNEEEPYQRSVEFKQAVVSSLAPVASAFLLDPSIGAGPCIANQSLPGSLGLIVTVEASGYSGQEHERISRLPSDWGVSKIKRMNASAVKLLVYYHSESPTSSAMKDLVLRVDEECKQFDIPLFLEILTYSPIPNQKLDSSKRTEAIVKAAEELSALGGDVLKVEFPVDVHSSPNPIDWEIPCLEMSQASSIPWVLLSAGVNFDVFLLQTEVACKAGASGVLAGRAIWKEALELQHNEWNKFLTSTATERMNKLKMVCNKFAKPYTAFIDELILDENWHSEYPIV